MITLGYSGFTRGSNISPGNTSPFAKTNLTFDNLFKFRGGEIPITMFPLGYLGHDASAAIIQDGQIVACAAEERFIRSKHSLNLIGNTLLPKRAIQYCLNELNISINDVDIVAHYCDFSQSIISQRIDLLKTYHTEEDMNMVSRSYQDIYDKMMSKEVVIEQFRKMTGLLPNKFVAIKHHMAHAASAFYPSGFEKALILTIDGTGEIESSLLAIGQGNSIREIRSTMLPTSLGALYLIITVFLGFRSLGDEYKVMSLAAYGNPVRFRDFFKSLVLLKHPGQYTTRLLSSTGLKDLLIKNLGPPRRQDEPVNQIHADIASSLQESLEKAVLHTLKHAEKQTGISNLCMAGGVALNCKLNGEIARSKIFRKIFVQPASSDEGCSLGAALYAEAQNNDQLKKRRVCWQNAYLGPEYTSNEITETIKKYRSDISWEKDDNITVTIAREIANGRIVGWCQGKMEFGPRALGNRSILADPRSSSMKDRINTKVKHREKFQPFAPAVLEEESHDYFNLYDLDDSPYMLFALPIQKSQHKNLLAITHIDGTARVQTVSKKWNPKFWELIAEFKKITGIPVLLNTSFNDRNEPIVCTPEDAIKCFLSTEIDVLAIDDYIIEKHKKVEI